MKVDQNRGKVGAEGSEPGIARTTLGWVGGVILGAVLLFGAWAKILDPSAFAQQISSEGLDFLVPANWVALIALALEIGLGVSLLIGLRKRSVLAASGLLVLFFLFLTGRAYYRFANGIVSDEPGCGCFGNLVERTPAEAFWQDMVLLVPTWILAVWGRATGALKYGFARVAVVGSVTAAGLVVALLSPRLPLDDLATRIGKGVEVTTLCTGAEDDRLCLDTVAPELREGHHLVVVTELDTEGFLAGVDRLNAKAMRGEGLMVLADATLEASQTFFWTYGPSFEIREAPASLLKPMYRTLPRSFEVVDGVITRTYVGLPEMPEAEPFVDPFAPPAEPSVGSQGQ